jgi:uncharacterized protein DUF5677
LHSEENFWQHAQTTGEAADIPEQLIFAWRRSGFIVAEHTRELMSENEYKEWTDAIDEYFEIKERGFDPFFIFTYLSGEEYELYKSLVAQLDHAIIVLGFALTAPIRLRDSANYFRYLLMQRAMRSLRTIREMYTTRYDDDCLSIARNMYEAYLRMKLLRLDQTSAERFEAIIAHEVGAFQTKVNKNGKPSYGICVDPQTGKEFKAIIYNREILEISDFPLDEPLYYDLYPLLSGFVHPDLTHDALRSIEARRADLNREGDPVRSIVLVVFVCVLVLLETAESTFLRTQTKRDIRHVIKTLCKSLLKFITADSIVKRKNVPVSIYNFFGFEIQET